MKTLNKTIEIDHLKLGKLSSEELIEVYNEHNSPEILDMIIKRYEKLVYSIANNYRNSNVEFNEILQLGFTGLVVAVNRFDINMNTKFSTSAVYCIKGEILHFIRDSKLVKIPRWLWKLNRLFDEFVLKFEMKNNRYPTKEEISTGINVSIESIDEILKARGAAYYNVSLDDDNYGELSIDNHYNKDLIKSRDLKSFGLVIEDKILPWDAIERLKSADKKILLMKYIFGLSQDEIGRKVGMSQKSVSRNLKETLKLLKTTFAGKA